MHKLRDITLKGILAGAILAGTATTPALFTKPAQAQETQKKTTPHYLQGIESPTDPVKKLFEKERVYDSISLKYLRERTPFINESIQVQQEILGKNITLTFVNYVNKGNHIANYTANGIEKLTPAEFDIVVQDHINYLTEAATLMEQRFKTPSQKIMQAVEANLRKQKKLPDDKKLEDILNEKIQGYEGITIRDVLFVPPQTMTAKEFLPPHYYFGTLPSSQMRGSILGVTYLNTGVVGIDPKARILDHINGVPIILMHEMMHNNKELQGLPLVFYFDAELYAELSQIANMDYLEISRHHYLEVPRRLNKLLFSFDSDLAFENVRDFTIMPGMKLEDTDNYKKLRKTISVLNNITSTLQTTALDEFFPEFYASPHYWVVVNEFHRDGAAAFKIFNYAKFEPTSLKGPEATRKFMEENRDVIIETSEKVLNELRGQQRARQTYGFRQPLLTFPEPPAGQSSSIASLFASATTYETRLEQQLRNKGFSEEEARVGVIMGERALFMKEIKDVDKNQGTIAYKYEFNYGGITIADMLETFTTMANELDEALSHKNSLKWEKFLDYFNLREQLEKKRTAITYIRDVLAQRQLHNEFRDYMGLRPKQIRKDAHKNLQDETYSIGLFLPGNENEMTFDAKYVQDARRAGKLTDERNIVESMTRDIMFHEKIPNPDYPIKDPNKEYIFKKRTRRLQIISYTLDDNTDKKPTYIEAYRLKQDGTRETHPALKIFKSTSSSSLDVLVADKDKEDNKKGFGKPDMVRPISGITTGSELQHNYPDIIEYLFKEEDVPPIPTIQTTTEAHIIETGKYPFAQYEIKQEGWQNEVPDHKQSEITNNYRIHVKLEEITQDDIEQNNPHTKKPRKIEWIAKSYRGIDGRIVKFYKPSNNIKDNTVIDIKGTATELELHEPHKPIQKYPIEYLLQEKPFRIDFDYSPERRWLILDRDGDGTYEAKQEIRKPDNLKLPELPR
ncbi:hypothetical protein HY484_04525 [Candidatus Woesearchaeota archaeon]|nr:hypothetical protein [Candidatus Woesearchaeota archaeon]